MATRSTNPSIPRAITSGPIFVAGNNVETLASFPAPGDSTKGGYITAVYFKGNSSSPHSGGHVPRHLFVSVDGKPKEASLIPLDEIFGHDTPDYCLEFPVPIHFDSEFKITISAAGNGHGFAMQNTITMFVEELT